MNIFNEAIEVADIHKTRILDAMTHLTKLFPMNSEKLSHIQQVDTVYLDALIHRFSKLQDYMGSKLIDLFLDSQGEQTHNLSMLDKLHKLEKMGVIEDSFTWLKMREIRNHLAHEYPRHPDITTKNLNDVFFYAPELIKLLNKNKTIR